MSQKFIVVLDAGTIPQRDAITSLLGRKGWDIRHFLDDVWLVADVPDDITPRVLWHEMIRVPALTPVMGVVLAMGPELRYWGGNATEAWRWMGERWGRPDLPTPQPGPDQAGVLSG